jgi:hypothetical protein
MWHVAFYHKSPKVDPVVFEPTTSSLRTMRSTSNSPFFFNHLSDVQDKNSPNYWDVIGT